MNLPALKSEKENNFPPILIVDRIGILGEALAKELSADYLVVLLSKSINEKSDKIIHIPFKKRIPQVPDNNYKKIFIVDDGDVVTKESVESFVAKAKENNTPLYFIGSIRNVDFKNTDEFISNYEHSKILVFGDLFDKNIFFDKDISISKFILQARKNLRILVEGNGLALSFPISFGDTIKLIIKASYIDIPQKTILLFYPHPITDISLANTFRKINPDVKIDFIKESKTKNIYIPGRAQHAIEKYNLEQKIRELDLENTENRKIRIISTKKIEERPILSAFILIVTLSVFLLLLPLASTSAYLYIGGEELKKSVVAIEEGDLVRAKAKADNASTMFGMSQKTLKPLMLEAQIVRQGDSVSTFTKKVDAGNKLSSAAIDLTNAAELAKGIQRNTSTDPKGDFQEALNLTNNAITLVTKVNAEGGIPSEFEESFTSLEPIMEVVTNSSQVLPTLMGFDKEITYLVLYQDNTHLRAGGGLVNGYGVLKVKDGKVISFKSFNASNIDKGITTRIEPPFYIRRYAKEQDLLFKDSNYDPDFVDSAIVSSQLYNLAEKDTVEGVIGMDYEFAKATLGVTGEVEAGKIGVINAQNIYENVDSKDYSIELADALVRKIKTGQNLSYFNLLKIIGESINEKHLLFAFRDSSLQKIFSINNWSSSLQDERSTSKNKINDYFGLNEANVGKNNLYNDISRSVSKKVSIDKDGEVTSKITISYKNSSDKKGSLGTYNNYAQVIVAKDSTLESISIDGKSKEIEAAIVTPSVYEVSSFSESEEIEVEEIDKENVNIFGIFLEVEPQKTKTIILTFKLPKEITKIQKEIDYSLKIVKQPGIVSFPFSLTFDLDKPFTVIDEKKVFNEEITKDEEAKFKFSQK